MPNIPTNLDECHEALKNILSPDDLAWFKQTGRYEHFHIGMNLRNAWGLWSGSPLKDYFKSIGIYHADDMSGIIFTSFYHSLKGWPFNLEAEVQRYQNHWKTFGGLEPIPDTEYLTVYGDEVEKTDL